MQKSKIDMSQPDGQTSPHSGHLLCSNLNRFLIGISNPRCGCVFFRIHLWRKEYPQNLFSSKSSSSKFLKGLFLTQIGSFPTKVQKRNSRNLPENNFAYLTLFMGLFIPVIKFLRIPPPVFCFLRCQK